MFFLHSLLEKTNIWDSWNNLVIARSDDSITTYDASVGGILLGNNNQSDNSYFFFMNTFLYFTNKVLFSGAKLESYS